MTKKDSKAGRPPFEPTAAQRRRVAIAAGGGMSHEEIALGLGITRPTLLKHFGFELSTGANLRRLEILSAMFATAKKGNVAAQKAYLQNSAPAAAPPLQPDAPAAKAPRLGKKDQAQVDAVTAGTGTDWNDLLKPSGPMQ